MPDEVALRLFCICEEEMCWCDTLIPFTDEELEDHYARFGMTAPEKACDMCQIGLHRWNPPR